MDFYLFVYGRNYQHDVSTINEQSLNRKREGEREREIITLILQIPRKTNFSSTQDNTLVSEISFSTGSITT